GDRRVARRDRPRSIGQRPDRCVRHDRRDARPAQVHRARRDALRVRAAMTGRLAGLALGLSLVAGAAGPAVARPAAAAPRTRALHVCADPNNMPFSNREGQGFENRIAALIARDLREPVRYTWWAQRRGFVRNTLNAERCDVVIGIIAGDDQLSTTTPYYRSSYVFVTRRSSGLPSRPWMMRGCAACASAFMSSATTTTACPPASRSRGAAS